MKLNWVRNLALTYAGKDGKEGKTVEIPATCHEELTNDMELAYRLLRESPSAKENYLAVNLTFVISDRAQRPGGDHRRTTITVPVQIPGKEIYTGSDLVSSSILTTGDVFARTGYHTEQVLYRYLESAAGQQQVYNSFYNTVNNAIANGQIICPGEGEKLKVYAVVIDMHSRLKMCKQASGHSTCNEATIAAQGLNGSSNVRYKLASILFPLVHISGYERTGAVKPGKIALKMATRVSCQAIWGDKDARGYWDNSDQSEAYNPPIARHTGAINRVPLNEANRLIIHKKIENNPAPSEQAYADLSHRRTIFRSSTVNGIANAFWRFESAFNGDLPGKINTEQAINTRHLLRFAPNLMRGRHFQEIIDNPPLLSETKGALRAAAKEVGGLSSLLSEEVKATVNSAIQSAVSTIEETALSSSLAAMSLTGTPQTSVKNDAAITIQKLYRGYRVRSA